MWHFSTTMRPRVVGARKSVSTVGFVTAVCLALLLSTTSANAAPPTSAPKRIATNEGASQAALCASIRSALTFMSPEQLEARARAEGYSEYWIARGKACLQ